MQCLEYLLLCVFSLEFLHSSFSVNDLLLACEERMTFGTYIKMNIWPCRFCDKGLTAGADNLCVFIIRVYSCFQFSPPETKIKYINKFSVILATYFGSGI